MMRTEFARRTAMFVAPMTVAFALVATLAALGHAQDEGASAPRGVPVAVAAQGQFDAQGKAREGAAQEREAAPDREDATEKEAGHFNAQGERISEKEARALAATTATAKACLELHNGPGVTWKIDVTFNPNSYPYTITGGTIKGTICGSPNWAVTGGSMGPSLLVNARRTGGASSCATSVTIVGSYRNPPSYAGTYGFNGARTGFSHTTLYCCGACPP